MYASCSKALYILFKNKAGRLTDMLDSYKVLSWYTYESREERLSCLKPSYYQACCSKRDIGCANRYHNIAMTTETP